MGSKPVGLRIWRAARAPARRAALPAARTWPRSAWPSSRASLRRGAVTGASRSSRARRATASGLRSLPTARMPASRASTSEVPEPQNGSTRCASRAALSHHDRASTRAVAGCRRAGYVWNGWVRLSAVPRAGRRDQRLVSAGPRRSPPQRARRGPSGGRSPGAGARGAAGEPSVSRPASRLRGGAAADVASRSGAWRRNLARANGARLRPCPCPSRSSASDKPEVRFVWEEGEEDVWTAQRPAAALHLRELPVRGDRRAPARSRDGARGPHGRGHAPGRQLRGRRSTSPTGTRPGSSGSASSTPRDAAEAASERRPRRAGARVRRAQERARLPPRAGGRASASSAIFAAAQRAPSWCNVQPWRVVVTEPPVHRRAVATTLVAAAAERPARRPRCRSRSTIPRRTCRTAGRCGVALYGAMGVARDDKAGRYDAWLRNYALFDAPHLAVVAVDERLGPYALLDVGVWLGYLLPAATADGLDTCADGLDRGLPRGPARAPRVRGRAADPVRHRDRPRGRRLGTNQFRTARAPVDSNVTFLDGRSQVVSCLGQ